MDFLGSQSIQRHSVSKRWLSSEKRQIVLSTIEHKTKLAKLATKHSDPGASKDSKAGCSWRVPKIHIQHERLFFAKSSQLTWQWHCLNSDSRAGFSKFIPNGFSTAYSLNWFGPNPSLPQTLPLHFHQSLPGLRIFTNTLQFGCTRTGKVVETSNHKTMLWSLGKWVWYENRDRQNKIRRVWAAGIEVWQAWSLCSCSRSWYNKKMAFFSFSFFRAWVWDGCFISWNSALSS